jgi:hypothetical protein
VPRPRLQVSAPQLSPGQASYVLDRLVSDRRISVGEINRYLSDMHREISELESRLSSLRSAAGTLGGGSVAAPVRRRPGRPRKVVAPTPVYPVAPPAPRGRRPGRRPGRPTNASLGIGVAAAAPAGRRRGRRARAAITPQQLASRQLQGRYLGLIRQIPASRRGTYQRIAKEQSREAAIREMESVLKK